MLGILIPSKYIQKELQKKMKKLVNPVKIHPEKIIEEDEKIVNHLNYDGIEYPGKKKILARSK